MPTDISLVAKHKAAAEVQASKNRYIDEIMICLWVVLGCVLAILTVKGGLDLQTALILLQGG